MKERIYFMLIPKNPHWIKKKSVRGIALRLVTQDLSRLNGDFYIGIFRDIREQSKKADSSDLPVSGDPSRTHTNEESAPICQDRQV